MSSGGNLFSHNVSLKQQDGHESAYNEEYNSNYQQYNSNYENYNSNHLGDYYGYNNQKYSSGYQDSSSAPYSKYGESWSKQNLGRE